VAAVLVLVPLVAYARVSPSERAADPDATVMPRMPDMMADMAMLVGRMSDEVGAGQMTDESRARIAGQLREMSAILNEMSGTMHDMGHPMQHRHGMEEGHGMMTGKTDMPARMRSLHERMQRLLTGAPEPTGS